MRLLYVTDDAGFVGGAGSGLLDQMEAQRRLGNSVEVVADHVPEAVNLFRPDLIHFHTIIVSTGLGALEWAQWRKIPHCLTLHDFWPFCGNRMMLRSLRDETLGVACETCDGLCENGKAHPRIREVVNRSPVIVNQHYQAMRLRANGVRVNAVINCGVDTGFWRPAPERRAADRRVFSSSAWFDWHWKGAGVMDRAFAGTSVEIHKIRDVPRSAVRDALQTGHVFLFPSTYHETWGLSLLEAMACGIACVASAVDGPRCMIEDGVDGVLVPPRDERALREATLALLADPERCDRLGEAAAAKVRERWTLERMGQGHKAFYERLLSGEVA